MEKKIVPLLNYLTTLGFEVKIVEVRERQVLLEVQGDVSGLSELALNMHLPFTVYAWIVDIQSSKAVIRIVDLEDYVPCVLKPFVPLFDTILRLYHQLYHQFTERWRVS